MAKKALFRAHELNEEQAQVIISKLVKVRAIPPNCPIELLYGTIFMGLSKCIICTDTKIIFFRVLNLPELKEFSYASITGASADNGTLFQNLLLHIGGSSTETFEIRIMPQEMRALLDFINSKIEQRSGQSSNVALAPSVADEIAKYHALKEQGIITEEEFNSKKKELLGL